MIPFANAGDYLNAIPHIRLERLSGVGHVPQEEAPLLLAGAVGKFLAGREGA